LLGLFTFEAHHVNGLVNFDQPSLEYDILSLGFVHKFSNDHASSYHAYCIRDLLLTIVYLIIFRILDHWANKHQLPQRCTLCVFIQTENKLLSKVSCNLNLMTKLWSVRLWAWPIHRGVIWVWCSSFGIAYSNSRKLWPSTHE